MFGLVKRQRLLESERQRVDLKVQIMRLEQQLAQAEDRARRADLDLAVARREIEFLEADRARLIEAVTARPAAQPEPDKPDDAPQQGSRSLSFLEVATRATAHRNRHNEAVAAAPAMTVIQAAAAEARQRRAKAAAAHAPRKEDL